MRTLFTAAVALAGLGLSAASHARDIVITNDDGLTSNVLALYKALKAQGHDVIVSVPCQNQSGMGAALKIGRPLGPLKEDCLNDAAKAGAPGAGAMTRAGLPAGDFFYVDGTPVMAMSYGVDVAARTRWGAAPDLVLSGPNEGQNLGAIILSSGTVSAAQAAVMRGIPAIALSAGGATMGDSKLANPASAKVAALTATFIGKLDALAAEGPLLPQGTALNVNFPDSLEGAVWKASRIGTYNAYSLQFVEDMAASATPEMMAMARQRGMDVPHLPGLSFAHNTAEPTPEQADDESVVYRSAISVSPMQAGYASPALEGWGEWLIEAAGLSAPER